MLSRSRKKLREYATTGKSMSTTEIQSLKRMVQAEAKERKKK
jgi:hypothetical protein